MPKLLCSLLTLQIGVKVQGKVKTKVKTKKSVKSFCSHTGLIITVTISLSRSYFHKKVLERFENVRRVWRSFTSEANHRQVDY